MISKKFFISLLVVGLLLNTTLVLGANLSMEDAAKRLNTGPNRSPISSPADISRILEQFVRWFYYIFFVLAVYFLLTAAFTYLTAGGKPENITKANKSLLWAFVAIAVALISVGAATIVKSFITPPGGS